MNWRCVSSSRLLPVYSCLLSSDNPLCTNVPPQHSQYCARSWTSEEKKKKSTNKHPRYQLDTSPFLVWRQLIIRIPIAVSKSPAFTSAPQLAYLWTDFRAAIVLLANSRPPRSLHTSVSTKFLLKLPRGIFYWSAPRNSCVGKSKTNFECITPQATRANWTLNIWIDFNDENLWSK